MTDSKYCNIFDDNKSVFDVLLISHEIFSILHESCILCVKTKTSCELCLCRLESPDPPSLAPQRHFLVTYVHICYAVYHMILTAQISTYHKHQLKYSRMPGQGKERYIIIHISSKIHLVEFIRM